MARKSADVKAAEAGFDFNSLETEDVIVEPDRSTPFDAALYASWETRNDENPVSKRVVVPAEYVKATKALIRKSGANQGIGTSIAADESLPGGKVAITFRGKDLRQVTRRSASQIEADEQGDDDNADTLEYSNEA